MMQYHVTCNKCRRSFTITAEGGDRMRCSCPYCGQTLLVNLPAMAQPATPPVVHPVSGQEDSDGGSPGLKILLTVLIVLVVGGLGAFGFILGRHSRKSVYSARRMPTR